MSTNTQVASFVSDISTSRLSDAEEAGLVLMSSSYLASMRTSGVDVELTALHRKALAQVDNSARGDVTELLGWMT